MRSLYFTLVAFSALALLMGLSPSCAQLPPKTVAEQAMKHEDPSKPILVKAGQDFMIVLESNRTTGYQWQIAEPFNTAVVTLIGTDYKPSDTDRIGAGGREIWAFRAIGKGKSSISFKYVRPWEKDIPPVKSAVFTVEAE